MVTCDLVATAKAPTTGHDAVAHWLPTGKLRGVLFKNSLDGSRRRQPAVLYSQRALVVCFARPRDLVAALCMARRFAAVRRFAAAAVVMAMKSTAAAGSRLTTDGRSVLVKRPELLTTAVASEGSRVEAIVAYATQGSNPD